MKSVDARKPGRPKARLPPLAAAISARLRRVERSADCRMSETTRDGEILGLIEFPEANAEEADDRRKMKVVWKSVLRCIAGFESAIEYL